MSAPGYSPAFVDFLEELGAEETIEREFKDGRGGLPRSIWDTISAFANTSGGIVVLGVQEQDEGLALVGVPNPHRMLDDFHNLNRNQQRINRDVDDKSVIVIRVRPAETRLRPIYINGQPYGGTRLRRHTGDHVATNEEVNRMMREASDLAADEFILPWARLEHLDREALSAYRRRVLILDERSPLAEFDEVEFLQAIEGYRRDLHSGQEGITVAGLLMFGSEMAIRQWRSRHLIDARLLPRGADLGEPDWADRVLWESHLYGAYNRIYPWLTRDLPVPFRLENGVRVDESEQHRVLREALVNMLVHADYAERGASLILRWDGGVLFRNPGRSRIPSPGFHGGNQSDPRNPALLRMFRRIRLAEEAGAGVPRIFRSWRELGYEPPRIDPGDERYEFAITLPYEHLLSDEDRAWLGAIAATFTDAEQLALVIARHEDGVDNQALREVTALHGADASKVLTGLRNHGFLEMEGSKRGAWYRLAAASPRLVESGLSSGSSEVSTGSSGLNSADNDSILVGTSPNLVGNDVNLMGKEASLVGNAGDLVDSERLLAIALPVRIRRRIAADLLKQTVIDLCAVEPLSVQQLATLLGRSAYQVGLTTRDLVAKGEIEPVHKERYHPRQRYVARNK
jgi:ATP-dependent DNA helicase RecG